MPEEIFFGIPNDRFAAGDWGIIDAKTHPQYSDPQTPPSISVIPSPKESPTPKDTPTTVSDQLIDEVFQRVERNLGAPIEGIPRDALPPSFGGRA